MEYSELSASGSEVYCYFPNVDMPQTKDKMIKGKKGKATYVTGHEG
jgi:hypothetical protein